MLKFSKMHGIGNDYVYMDAINQDIDDVSNLARFVSDRHFGIGSDGLILICKSDVADFRMRMFNSDGSEAEMCGNGIRCVGKFVYDKRLTDKKVITVETLAGIKTLVLNVKDSYVESVRVDMGEPILRASMVPVISNEDTCMNLNLDVLDRSFRFSCVSMGNPHAITLIDDDVMDFDVKSYGSLVEVDRVFPRKTNVEFINVRDRNNVDMRVWERGAGETFACGTGACATLVSCVLNDYTDNRATIHLLGGDLDIEWNREDNHIYMTGSATMVYDGVLNDVKMLEKYYDNYVNKVKTRKVR